MPCRSVCVGTVRVTCATLENRRPSIIAEEECLVLLDRSAQPSAEAVVVDDRLGQAGAIVVPRVRVQIVVLKILVERAVEMRSIRAVRSARSGRPKRASASHSDSATVARNSSTLSAGVGTDVLAGDQVRSDIDSVERHRVLIVDRAGDAHGQVAATGHGCRL